MALTEGQFRVLRCSGIKLMIRLCAVIVFFGYVVTSQPPPVLSLSSIEPHPAVNIKDSTVETFKSEDEYKRRVLKIETDFVEKLDNKDRKVKVRALEAEKKDASKEISAVKVSLRNGEGIVSVRGVRGGLLGLS